MVEFVFEEAKPGLFVFTLYEARGLRQLDTSLGKQDPYVDFSLGRSCRSRSLTVENGGSAPYFAEEEVALWADESNWANDLLIRIGDDEMGVEPTPIAFTQFSLLPYMNSRPNQAKQDTYDLFYIVQADPHDEKSKKEISGGELVMKVSF